jgi:hypothetical protein
MKLIYIYIYIYVYMNKQKHVIGHSENIVMEQHIHQKTWLKT